MIKKINKFLNDNFRLWDHTDDEGRTIILTAMLSFIILFVGQFIFNHVMLWFSVLCLVVTFVPPIILGVKAVVKKEKFNPHKWFLSIEGIVLGGLLACLVLFLIRGIIAIISVIC